MSSARSEPGGISLSLCVLFITSFVHLVKLKAEHLFYSLAPGDIYLSNYKLVFYITRGIFERLVDESVAGPMPAGGDVTFPLDVITVPSIEEQLARSEVG